MRVEIGPGPEKLGDDWTTVSAVPGPAVDFLAEWGLDRLPFDDASVDEVYACHVIEHIGWMHVEAALMEAWRILKPGGLIEIHTIDAEAIFADALTGSLPDWEDRFDHPIQAANYRLYAYPKVTGDRACANWHHGCLTRGYLSWLLSRSGFIMEQMRENLEPRGDEKHGAYNMGVLAVKR